MPKDYGYNMSPRKKMASGYKEKMMPKKKKMKTKMASRKIVKKKVY